MVVFSASSWRSIAYMVEAVRGIMTPVRIGTWLKPVARTKVKTKGWNWASVSVIAMRKGPKNRKDLADSPYLDYVVKSPVTRGRRAELPRSVAKWAVQPYACPGGVFLDPFAGSGKLVRAASECGMRAYGFEINV